VTGVQTCALPIFAILAAIAVPNFLEAQTRAKVSRAKADMRSISTGVASYVVDFSVYPDPDTETWHPSLLEVPGLTTPIAYLTAFPREAFPRKEDELYASESMFGNGDYYRYYNTKRWKLPSRTRQTRLKWFLMSHGPDLVTMS
jgi:hypothetical protein